MYEKEIKQLLANHSELTNIKGWLAGGALTAVFSNQFIRDYDVYFASKEDFLDDLEYMMTEENAFVLDVTDRAVTMNVDGDVVQFMCFDFFPSSQAIFDLFDYTINMGALNLRTKQLELDDRFLADIAQRQLVFNHKTRFPLASAMRLHKYLERGYTITKFELLKVVTAVGLKEVNSWDILKAQLGGAYGDQVELKAKGEFTLDNVMEAMTGDILEYHKDFQSYEFSDIKGKLFPVQPTYEPPFVSNEQDVA